MAGQNQIIKSDVKNFNITNGIKWTLQKFSGIPYDTKVFSPDFYIALSCMCSISLRKYDSSLHVYICNKSYNKIEIVRRIVLYDCNNKKLYEENNERIFILEKDIDVNLISRVDRHPYESLTNDTLIIDLSVTIMHNALINISKTDSERKLIQDFKTMLENTVNSDICLQVGDEQIPAHWSILCSRSPYFKRMFESGMKESVQNSVTITDSTFGTVKKLIQFLYSADFNEGDDFQELCDLYYAADKYEVMDLRSLCGLSIISNVTVDNACEIFEISRRHSDKDLKMLAIDFIESHSDSVFQTEGWKKFEVSDPEIAELISYFLRKK